MAHKDSVRFQVLNEFCFRKISRSRASEILGVSERTISRWSTRLRNEGILGLQHRNKGKRPSVSVDLKLKQQVMALIRGEFFDFNISHLKETLETEYGIKLSYSTLRRWCHEYGLVKHIRVRRRVVRKPRPRMPREGFILQMDGSHHRWNGEDEWCLIAAIDDATSEIPYAEFFKSETTLSCLKVLKKIIEKKGLPSAIYTDRAGWSGGNNKRMNFSQFKRACEALGIQLIFANSPEAKGRIERSFKTIQDRLIPEMRRKNITSRVCANKYLQSHFIPHYWNEKNTVLPVDPEPAYRAVPSDLDLDQVLCIETSRKIARDQSISFAGKKLVIKSDLGINLKGYRALIRRYINGKTKAFVLGREIDFELFEKPKSYLGYKEPEVWFDAFTLFKYVDACKTAVWNSKLYNQELNIMMDGKKIA